MTELHGQCRRGSLRPMRNLVKLGLAEITRLTQARLKISLTVMSDLEADKASRQSFLDTNGCYEELS